jgi:hypothetical protein
MPDTMYASKPHSLASTVPCYGGQENNYGGQQNNYGGQQNNYGGQQNSGHSSDLAYTNTHGDMQEERSRALHSEGHSETYEEYMERASTPVYADYDLGDSDGDIITTYEPYPVVSVKETTTVIDYPETTTTTIYPPETTTTTTTTIFPPETTTTTTIFPPETTTTTTVFPPTTYVQPMASSYLVDTTVSKPAHAAAYQLGGIYTDVYRSLSDPVIWVSDSMAKQRQRLALIDEQICQAGAKVEMLRTYATSNGATRGDKRLYKRAIRDQQKIWAHRNKVCRKL